MQSLVTIYWVLSEKMFEKDYRQRQDRTHSDGNRSHGLSARWAKKSGVYEHAHLKFFLLMLTVYQIHLQLENMHSYSVSETWNFAQSQRTVIDKHFPEPLKIQNYKLFIKCCVRQEFSVKYRYVKA